MATTEENVQQYLVSVKRNGPYTIEEAREVMKVLNLSPTNTSRNVRWVNVRTKRPVAFSY